MERFKIGSKIYPCKPVFRGVPQVCLLTPLLFNRIGIFPKLVNLKPFQIADDLTNSVSAANTDELGFNLLGVYSKV